MKSECGIWNHKSNVMSRTYIAYAVCLILFIVVVCLSFSSFVKGALIKTVKLWAGSGWQKNCVKSAINVGKELEIPPWGML